jgi:hypothetical protein
MYIPVRIERNAMAWTREQDVEPAHRFSLIALNFLSLNFSEFFNGKRGIPMIRT